MARVQSRQGTVWQADIRREVWKGCRARLSGLIRRGVSQEAEAKTEGIPGEGGM